MTTLHGVDVSNFQSASTLHNVSNASFAIVKATEGLTFRDPLHSAHVAAARQRGILVGHYHFAHVSASASAQANAFVTFAQPRAGEVLVLDFEPYGQAGSPASYGQWIVEFANTVRSATGAPCWLYLDGNMLGTLVNNTPAATMTTIRQMPLWKAVYAGSPGSFGGWSHFTAWQFTSSPIDSDVFYGDADDWRALGVPGAVSTAAKPEATTTSTACPFTSAQVSGLAKLLKVAAQPFTVSQALQAHLNGFHGAKLATDGVVGPLTIKALQACLNWEHATPQLDLDGDFGPLTSAALTAQLNKGTI